MLFVVVLRICMYVAIYTCFCRDQFTQSLLHVVVATFTCS